MPDDWRTVGGLIKAGVEVYAHCHVCQKQKLADLAAIAERRGADFSLCDMRAACQTPDCWGYVLFFVRSGMNSRSLTSPAKRRYWLWEAPDRWLMKRRGLI